MQKNLGLSVFKWPFFGVTNPPESPSGPHGSILASEWGLQSIRIRNEKMLEEAVRETIRARGSQDIETAKVWEILLCGDVVSDQTPVTVVYI